MVPWLQNGIFNSLYVVGEKEHAFVKLVNCISALARVVIVEVVL